MANPARTPDPRLDPVDREPRSADPLTTDSRLTPANSQTVNRAESRTGGTGILIAAVVLVLALIAYFAFAPGDDADVVPGDTTIDTTITEEPAAPADTTSTAPADTTTTAPADTTTTAPADTTTTAPDATAPADTAPADTTAPAPDASAPAEPAPAPIAPAPAQ